MSIYDVFFTPSEQTGEDLQASLHIHSDGRKTWKNSKEWKSFYCSDEEKRLIEEAVERYPHQESFPIGLCTVKLRRP